MLGGAKKNLGAQSDRHADAKLLASDDWHVAKKIAAVRTWADCLIAGGCTEGPEALSKWRDDLVRGGRFLPPPTVHSAGALAPANHCSLARLLLSWSRT